MVSDMPDVELRSTVIIAIPSSMTWEIINRSNGSLLRQGHVTGGSLSFLISAPGFHRDRVRRSDDVPRFCIIPTKWSLAILRYSKDLASLYSHYKTRKIVLLERSEGNIKLLLEITGQVETWPVREEGSKMKKILVAGLATVVLLFLAVQPAQARHGHAGGAFLLGLGLGFLLSPPIVYSPPPVYYAPAYPSYPPAGYYRYEGPPAPSRAWVHGHWEWRWNPYYRYWDKVWIPAHWSYY